MTTPSERSVLTSVPSSGVGGARGTTQLAITVLVPSFRRPDALRRCLESLTAQERAPEEVIVVVRQEDEETHRVIREQRTDGFNVRQTSVSVPGLVAALTAGLETVRTDVVAITDDDVVATPDWLARIEQHLRARPEIGAVGGRDWVHKDDGVLDGARREVGRVRWYGRVIGNHHLGEGPPRPVDVLKGANMSFRTRALGDLRPDARLLGQGAQVHSELGLCLAIAHRGWTILYDPALAVHHYPAERFDDDARDRPSTRALTHAAHNELYLLLRWLPLWRKPFALAYALLIGNRRAPGIVVFIERLVRERNIAPVAARFGAAQRGRVAAIFTALGRPSHAACAQCSPASK
jgi:cellulose synthase/poly-beta-1,6-N-acetylglucosamine synthase-like glycosyltransferase